jgi:hypothetical protein
MIEETIPEGAGCVDASLIRGVRRMDFASLIHPKAHARLLPGRFNRRAHQYHILETGNDSYQFKNANTIREEETKTRKTK